MHPLPVNEMHLSIRDMVNGHIHSFHPPSSSTIFTHAVFNYVFYTPCTYPSMDVTISMGAGGSAMAKFIKDVILRHLSPASTTAGSERLVGGDVPLDYLDDASVMGDVAFTTDSHTVKPLFFPGGDIGKLAVSGTINDVSAIGAMPIALSMGWVLEEGLAMDVVERIMASTSETMKEAGVPIITGDTKWWRVEAWMSASLTPRLLASGARR